MAMHRTLLRSHTAPVSPEHLPWISTEQAWR